MSRTGAARIMCVMGAHRHDGRRIVGWGGKSPTQTGKGAAARIIISRDAIRHAAEGWGLDVPPSAEPLPV